MVWHEREEGCSSQEKHGMKPTKPLPIKLAIVDAINKQNPIVAIVGAFG